MRYIFVIILSNCLFLVTTYAQTTPADTTKMAVTLKDVEVKAEGLVIGHDKTVLYVGKNLQKHSYDGYSLLNVAMIPGLEVNPFEHTIKSQNQGVLVCINGIPATKDDIKTINPRDVTRIDFYTGYDPRHPANRFTLDFIVKIRNYGGQVVMQAMQHLNRVTGSDLIDWRMYRNHVEFGVRTEENYDTYAQGRSEEENFSLAFEKGDVEFCRFSEQKYNRLQSLQVKPYLVYRKKNETLQITLALRQEHSRQRNADREQYIRFSEETLSDAVISDHGDRLLPALGGMYQHKFSNTSYFTVFFGGNYSRTNQIHHYSTLEKVISHTHEDFYGGNASMQYTFGFLKKHNGAIAIGGGVNHSKINYIENEASSVSMLTARNAKFLIADNWRLNRSLSLRLILSGDIINTDNTYRKSTSFVFVPSLSFDWTIVRNNSLSGSLSIRSQRPPMSYYFSAEKWIMPYLRQIGNPNLKLSVVTNANINYRHIGKWGYFELFGSYAGTSRSVYYDFVCNNYRDVYIQTFRNGRTFHDLSAGPRIQFKVIPQKLTLRVGGVWNYTHAFTYKSLHRHSFKGDVNLMYTSGGFSANVICKTPAKYMDALGITGYVPWSLQMSVSYNVNNWNFGLATQNPFITTPTRSRAELPGITTSSRNYSQRSRYNMVSFTLGYRFSYGKPKKQYENVELKQSENTAILGH